VTFCTEARDGEVSEAYLSDANGRIVTPIITHKFDESEGRGVDKEAAKRELAAKRITGLNGVRLEQEKMLQQLEEKRRLVGAGLDRAGCTLAAEQRRRGFYDDEDFSDVIPAEEIDEVRGFD